MNLANFQKLLRSELDVKAHMDDVPQNARYPAVSYRHQAHSAAILQNGNKSGRSDTWVVLLQTKKEEDVEKLVNQVERLHNFSNDDYQRVFVRIGNTAPKATDESVRTTTVTIQTYSRG